MPRLPSSTEVPPEETYDAAFFQMQMEGSARSAAVVVPLLLQFVPAESVVDVGCGTGVWLERFTENGVARILGIDGGWVDQESLRIPPDCFTAHDVRRPIHLDERFDLAISLEVAEHLPEQAGEILVESLTRLSSVVVFSAGVPCQGGKGHVNERWPDYWARVFASQGYMAIDCVRPLLWVDSRVDFWYRQNILLFASREALTRSKILRDESVRSSGPLTIAHPELVHLLQAKQQRLLQVVAEPPLRNFLPAALRKLRRRVRRGFEAIGRVWRRIQ